jgi:hypothetical protein
VTRTERVLGVSALDVRFLAVLRDIETLPFILVGGSKREDESDYFSSTKLPAPL